MRTVRGSEVSQFSIFISYSHKDKKYHAELTKYLQAWLQLSKGTVWHDGEIVPGTNWKPQIEKQLRKADIILLLISVDFLLSPFIRHHELGQALRRHNAGTARVVPILVRSVYKFERYPFGRLQVLPSNAKPIEKWQHRADACTDVIEGLERVIKDMKTVDGRKRHSAGRKPASPRA